MKALPTFALLLAFLPLAAQAASASRSHDLWVQTGYHFTPAVEAAYIAEAKAAALAKLKAEGKELPADFLAWVDANPARKATVYGARRDASGILVILRSLDLDLGQEAVRGKWEQLALAMAVAHGKAGDTELARASLTPRQPLVLKISDDPRVPVNTHAKDRPLDLNDHIINFLNDHTIEEEVIVGWKESIPKLIYDAKGVAIPQPKAKPPKEAIREKRKRPLCAADVIASADLEKQFNVYMAEHGHPDVKIDCSNPKGERLSWKSHDAHGLNQQGIHAAYDLFLNAYKAKGLFPKERDPVPTLAERCAFLIRNFNHTFSEEGKAADKKIVWPFFPLDKAPWPVLTLLAHDAQPLREREEAWERYRDRGNLPGYGEYIGNIAQNGEMTSARRLTPFAFNYGSLQMMLKDGGVCGTMAGIAARGKSTMGIPASTAGQPSHCALVMAGFDSKTNTWDFHGGQYVTAGDAGTGVHMPWSFGDVDTRRNMVYHQSVAYSVNFNLQSFFDAHAAHSFYGMLPSAEQQAHGGVFLTDAITKAPYAIFLDDDAAATLTSPSDIVAFLKAQLAAYPKGKPGCMEGGLHATTVKTAVFARLAALPPPKDQAQARAIFDFMTANQCANPKTLAAYKAAAVGVPAAMAETEAAFKIYLSGQRTYESSTAMAETLATIAACITDGKARTAWAKERFAEIQGHEMFIAKFKHNGAIYKSVDLLMDKSTPVLAKLAGEKLRPQGEQLQSYLDALVVRFKAYVESDRTPASSHAMAAELVPAGIHAARLDKDAAKRFAEDLAKTLAEHETFPVKHKPQRDSCADAIAKIAEAGK